MVHVLHDPVLLKSSHGTRSQHQHFLDPFFAASLLESFGEYFGFGFHRNHTYTVDVAKEQIAWTKANRANLDGNTKVDHLVTGAESCP